MFTHTHWTVAVWQYVRAEVSVRVSVCFCSAGIDCGALHMVGKHSTLQYTPTVSMRVFDAASTEDSRKNRHN